MRAVYRLIFAASVAGAFIAAGAASAQNADWYVQGNAGASFASRFDDNPHHDGDAGWALSGQAGRDFGNGWRADAEVLYFDAQDTHGFGRTSLLGGFVNGYYNFFNKGAWRPFVGAGVGVADVRSFGASDTRFAYQAKVGIDHPFSDRLTGEVAYRYVGVPGLRAEGESGGFHGDYHASLVTVGLRYRFGP
jgi:OOP family OmpA-OmpF porin